MIQRQCNNYCRMLPMPTMLVTVASIEWCHDTKSFKCVFSPGTRPLGEEGCSGDGCPETWMIFVQGGKSGLLIIFPLHF